LGWVGWLSSARASQGSVCTAASGHVPGTFVFDTLRREYVCGVRCGVWGVRAAWDLPACTPMFLAPPWFACGLLHLFPPLPPPRGAVAVYWCPPHTPLPQNPPQMLFPCLGACREPQPPWRPGVRRTSPTWTGRTPGGLSINVPSTHAHSRTAPIPCNLACPSSVHAPTSFFLHAKRCSVTLLFHYRAPTHILPDVSCRCHPPSPSTVPPVPPLYTHSRHPSPPLPCPALPPPTPPYTH
jgi:hypothetical protein